MTREEHWKIVDAVIDAYKDNEMGGKYSKAFNHGVQSAFNRVCKALEDIKNQQQPCEDCISREAVIEHINLYPKIIGDRSALALEIKALPSVTPQRQKGKWIDDLITKVLTEVDGGTDDLYIRYNDICERIEASIKEFFGAEMSGGGEDEEEA